MSTAQMLTLPGQVCTLWTMQQNRHGTVAEPLLCWYILLPKSGWLQSAQIIIWFFPHRHGIPLLVSSLKITLKIACLRIVGHPGQDFFFSFKSLAGIHVCGDVQKRWILILMYLLYFQFQIKTYILYGKKKRGRERGCRVSVTSHNHIGDFLPLSVVRKPLMNACLTCATKSCNSWAVSAALETSSAHSPGICSLGFTNSGGSEPMNWV